MTRRKVNSLVTRANRRRQEAFDKLLAACKAVAAEASIQLDANERNWNNQERVELSHPTTKLVFAAITFAEETTMARRTIVFAEEAAK